MQEIPESLMKELIKFVDTWNEKLLSSFFTSRVCMLFERILLENELLDEAELLNSMPDIGIWVLAFEGQTSTGKPIRFYLNPVIYTAVSLRLVSWDYDKSGKDKLIFAQALKDKSAEFRDLISDTLNHAESTQGLVVHSDAIMTAIGMLNKNHTTGSPPSSNRFS